MLRSGMDLKEFLLPALGVLLLIFEGFRIVISYFRKRKEAREEEEWVPVGRVKELWIYPIKSCKGIRVFNLHCGKVGCNVGEIEDRQFVVLDGKTNVIYTGRSKTQLVHIESDVVDGKLIMRYGEWSCSVDVQTVLKEKKVIMSTFFDNRKAEGLDCGDEAGEFLAKVFDNPDARLLMFEPSLKTERDCVADPRWWKNNPVPKRDEKIRYMNATPYMLSSEGSLIDLNKQLAENGVDQKKSSQFRANIVVSDCLAWDENKWLDLKIGEQVRMQCFKPCQRCQTITVDPDTAVREQKVMQTLRKHKPVPEGSMREAFGFTGIFGVQAALDKEGYIYEGATVWAKYKKSEF